MNTPIVQVSKEALQQAAAILQDGGLVVFPTDTVYGLAAHPLQRGAVTRIYEVKGRSTAQPIALLLADPEDVEDVAVVSEVARLLVERFWPGGLTLVLPKSGWVRSEISPGDAVGVRVPDLPSARALIRAAGGILAVTSANRSGEPPACSAQEALEQLGGRVDLIVDGGPCPGGVPSTVLDCTVWPPAVLRQGAVSEEEVRWVIG